jgi:hypothetical protein
MKCTIEFGSMVKHLDQSKNGTPITGDLVQHTWDAATIGVVTHTHAEKNKLGDSFMNILWSISPFNLT